MNEIVIIMTAIVLVGIIPIIAVAVLALRALKKSFEQIENSLDTRFENFEQGVDRFDDVLQTKEEHIQETIDIIKALPRSKGRKK